MRTLILTGPETEEQRAIAQALKAAFVAQGGSCLAVGALTLLGRHTPLSLIGAMEQTALNAPRAFAFLSPGASFSCQHRRRQLVYEVNARYAANLRILLTEGDFDAVVCLHRYPAEAVALLRKVLPFSARCCFVSADYAIVPFLEEATLDLVFTAHEDFAAPYEKRGLPAEKIVPGGIPLPDAWFRAEEQADARTLLNLPQDVPCYFIQSAADPAGVVAALLERLQGANVRICAVLPDDPQQKADFSARFAGDIRVVAVSPDESLPLYRVTCDVLLAVPSGAVSTAAAASGVPLVHLPPQNDFEAQNARFFSSRGMSAAAESLDEAAGFALALAKDAAARDEMRAHQQAVCDHGATERIVRRLQEGSSLS